MHPCRCCNEYVWMTEDNALLSPRLHHAPPLENHFLVDGKNSAGEPRPEFPVQPMVQFFPKPRILLKLDAVPNFGKSNRAQIELLRGLRIRPSLHFWVGLGFAQFGHDIGVHQTSVQRSTLRTGPWMGSRPNSSRLRGEPDKRSCRVGAPLGARSCSNSSAETTTTALRPFTVTRCGCPAAARRTTLLSSAFASPSFQTGSDAWEGTFRSRFAMKKFFVTKLVKRMLSHGQLSMPSLIPGLGDRFSRQARQAAMPGIIACWLVRIPSERRWRDLDDLPRHAGAMACKFPSAAPPFFPIWITMPPTSASTPCCLRAGP